MGVNTQVLSPAQSDGWGEGPDEVGTRQGGRCWVLLCGWKGKGKTGCLDWFVFNARDNLWEKQPVEKGAFENAGKTGHPQWLKSSD